MEELALNEHKHYADDAIINPIHIQIWEIHLFLNVNLSARAKYLRFSADMHTRIIGDTHAYM